MPRHFAKRRLCAVLTHVITHRRSKLEKLGGSLTTLDRRRESRWQGAQAQQQTGATDTSIIQSITWRALANLTSHPHSSSLALAQVWVWDSLPRCFYPRVTLLFCFLLFAEPGHGKFPVCGDDLDSLRLSSGESLISTARLPCARLCFAFWELESRASCSFSGDESNSNSLNLSGS